MDVEQKILEQQAKIFKALGHPARLKMTCLLREGPKSVGELTDYVGLDMSTVSKHLSVLKEAQIVSSSKRASTVFYKLELRCLDNFLICCYSFIAKDNVSKASTPCCCAKNN